MYRKIITSIIALTLVSGTLFFHYNQSPPTAWTSREPLGWPVGKPTPTLDGSLAALSRAAWNGMLTLPITTRIAAYSSLAYQKAAFANNQYNPDAGVVAFTETAAELITNPGLQEIVRTPAKSILDPARSLGVKVAKEVINQSRTDGYDQAFNASIPATSTPEFVRWKGSIYGPNSAEEPGWGSLKPIIDTICTVPPSEIDTLAELINSNTVQAIRAEQNINNPAIAALTIYWVATEGVARSEHWQGWVRTLQDNLPKKETLIREKALTNAMILMHTALIKAWHYKWRYQLSSWPDAQTDIDLIEGRLLVPLLSPGYPDELSALASVAAATLEYAQVENVRIEFPGKLSVSARTRVLENPQSALKESQTASLALGLKTEESTKRGSELGKCVFDTFISKESK